MPWPRAQAVAHLCGNRRSVRVALDCAACDSLASEPVVPPRRASKWNA